MEQCEKCQGCSNHFSNLRSSIQDFSVSKHFPKDLDNYQQVIEKVMRCDKQGAEELHKFEEKIDDIYLFRAKINRVHIVYAIDSSRRIIFLRAFKNFNLYKKFLDNKKGIKQLVKV